MAPSPRQLDYLQNLVENEIVMKRSNIESSFAFRNWSEDNLQSYQVSDLIGSLTGVAGLNFNALLKEIGYER
jgi:hypothetical protein